MKMTSQKDDLKGQNPHRQRKTTSQEDNLTGRLHRTKKAMMEEKLEEIKPHR